MSQACVLRPLCRASSKTYSWFQEVLIVVVASLLIALSAPLSLRLSFTPVPLVLQAQLILLLALCIGSKRAAIAVLTVIGQAVMGLPVLASGKIGMAVLLGPYGGYVVGYLVGAYVTGWIMEKRRERTPLGAFYAMGIGNLLIFCLGVPWLSLYLSLKSAFILGFFPFILGDLIKLLLAAKATTYVPIAKTSA